ncbi:MAG TPA: YihY/virulence factor BrkB family protein [Alphaproteobacteria bacterium]|nr:YihY/virulence factor BrkB family protein [Alphaproteobacteria bacterium]
MPAMLKSPSEIAELLARARDAIWHTDLRGRPRWQVASFGMLRVTLAVLRDLSRGELTLWAMSLVYTTLLSLVPLLAISFSVLKGFGVHNQIEPFLLHLLEPLGEKGVEITDRIIQFVENVRVGVLGSLGLALLFYTVISVMQKIERAFNRVWRVTRERTLGQRFRDYVSVLVVGPTLVFAAVGISATVISGRVVAELASIEPLGTLIAYAGRLVPFLMIVGAFTFMYTFIPNTRVRVRAAFAGGLVAGLLWNTVGWLFTAFVVGSVKYTAIYSTFATLIFFMIWVYLGWLILLVGSAISYYIQNPAHALPGVLTQQLSAAGRDRLGLALAALISENYYRGLPAWTADALADRLGGHSEHVDEVLAAMERGGVLAQTQLEPPTWLPARPFEQVTAGELLQVLRHDGRNVRVATAAPVGAAVALADAAEEAAGAALAERSLKQLGLEHDD